jgi:hypothetical protein
MVVPELLAFSAVTCGANGRVGTQPDGVGDACRAVASPRLAGTAGTSLVPVIIREAVPAPPAAGHPEDMRHPLALIAVLAAALCVGGCGSAPGDSPPEPPPSLMAAAARTPSPLPSPSRSAARTLSRVPSRVPSAESQPSARTALVATDPSRRSGGSDREAAAGEKQPSPGFPALERPPQTRIPERPRRAAPPAPARPRARSTAPAASRPRAVPPRPAPQPTVTYDLSTLCRLSGQAPVPPSVKSLCDTYFR